MNLVKYIMERYYLLNYIVCYLITVIITISYLHTGLFLFGAPCPHELCDVIWGGGSISKSNNQPD